MIPNTNDGSGRVPRVRIDINGSNVFGLPETSTPPRGDDKTVMQGVKAAGFEGIQTGSKYAVAREAGLRITGSGRIDKAADAETQLAEAAQRGYDCYTVHVGYGLEDDDESARLVEATLRASEKHKVPVYIETHRATVTQDIWRTVQLTKKFPEIRFNGDFSHYYTGLEMVYGDIEAKWQFMQPIFDRVRFLHGRIGNPGSMQVDIGPTGDGITYVDHFKEMWTRSFVAFLGSAGPGDYIIFAPELLGSSNFYARLFKDASGKLAEEGDRWQQALLYAKIARKCFDEAVKRSGHGD
jgi:hypothetical protein